MKDRIQVTKLEAARRQLDVAIQLLFDNADPVAAHTLVGAASVIISDLTERHHPDESWDKFAQEANNFTANEYFQIMRKTQNFLKHARDDAEAILDFNPDDTESLAFWAVMNIGNFGMLSIPQSVLQLWYFACRPALLTMLNLNGEQYNCVLEMFGDISKASRPERLAVAQKVLSEQLAAGN